MASLAGDQGEWATSSSPQLNHQEAAGNMCGSDFSEHVLPQPSWLWHGEGKSDFITGGG